MSMPFFIRVNRILKRIDPTQVICLQTQKNYTKIVLSDKTYFEVRSTLKGALKKLPSEIFMQIHKSLVASIYFIDDVAKDHLVIMGESVPIGGEYYDAVIKKLNIIGEAD